MLQMTLTWEAKNPYRLRYVSLDRSSFRAFLFWPHCLDGDADLSKALLIVPILAVLLTLHFIFSANGPSWSYQITKSRTESQEVVSHHTPRITMVIVLHEPNRVLHYFPDFFASVGANPDVALFWSNTIGRQNRTRSMAQSVLPTRAGADCERQGGCLSFERYWDMHAEWLCGRWGGCADGDGISGKELVKAKMKERANGDMYNGFFRPFRASIFSAWIILLRQSGGF
ncbi:hypothetical protein CPB85DRAFT_774854 [Mucidula mucida]|nr:hypothetical protein CPB85DRAFT_774854 [Mucidula mucida]